MTTILQLSDIHLFSTKDQVYNGSNPYINLKKVIDHIIKDKVSFDFLVLTGDLSNDFTPHSYNLLKAEIDRLSKKYFIIPGNHDDLRVMSAIFSTPSHKESFDYSIDHGSWSFYFLDSTVPPSVHGEILPSQLEKLKEFLKNNLSPNVAIFMHHHPIDSDSPHMNQFILKDKYAFIETIKPFPSVKGVFFGHIHQIVEKQMNNVLFASCPSTFYQITPKLIDFSVEKTIPGYRLIWFEDKSIDSKVVWVE